MLAPCHLLARHFVFNDNLGMRHLALLLCLSGCTSLSVDRDENIAQDSVSVIDNGVFGTRTTVAPDVTAFPHIEPQLRRVFFECQFEAKSECEKEIGRLMLAKQFILLSADGLGAERWLFRFEEKRDRPGEGPMDSPLDKNNKSQMWGSLSRFEFGESRPFSHLVVSGISQFQRGAWQPTLSKPTSSDTLMATLIKALIIKAIADPKAGSDQID